MIYATSLFYLQYFSSLHCNFSRESSFSETAIANLNLFLLAFFSPEQSNLEACLSLPADTSFQAKQLWPPLQRER